MVAQELPEGDHETCAACCKNIFENVCADAVLITSDETHFHLSGSVNKQNFCYWSKSNPRELHEKLLHSQQKTVWCALANFGVWGTYFFEKRNKFVSVTSARYMQMLQNFLYSKLLDLGENTSTCFQHDGATTHIAEKSINVLRGLFPVHLIFLRDHIGWLVQSPDLSPCDYFLWGSIKYIILYTNRLCRRRPAGALCQQCQGLAFRFNRLRRLYPSGSCVSNSEKLMNFMHFNNSCARNCDNHILLITTGNAHKESCQKLLWHTNT